MCEQCGQPIDRGFKQITIASDEERAIIANNPKVQKGLRDYFARYRRHGGKIPTITIEEALARFRTPPR